VHTYVLGTSILRMKVQTEGKPVRTQYLFDC
jgi:hypothetical protein